MDNIIVIFIIFNNQQQPNQQMSKLQMHQLLSALKNNQPQQKQSNSLAQEFITQSHSHLVKQLPLKQQLKIKRQSTYRSTQEQADKWIGIVKLNREKDSLNFAKVERDNAATVNFFPSAPISSLHNKIQQQLKHMQIQSQGAVLQQQKNVLEKMSKQQAKERLKQARKQRTMVMNEQIKRRRISKIKSKLYHRIKKRQKMREQSKRIEGLGHEQRHEYIQKLTKQRIHERITLRHKSKSKYIQDLLRFNKGGKNSIQQSLNQINRIRKDQLQKVNEMFLENMSQQYDEDNYRQNALQELQQQIDHLEKAPQKGLDAMKFMKLGREQEIQQHRSQVNKIANLLHGQEGFQMADNEMEEEGLQQDKGVIKIQRGKKQNIEKPSINYSDKNLKNYLSSKNQEQLTQGINVHNLKSKYQPNIITQNLSQVINHHSLFSTNQLQPSSISALDNFKEFQQHKQGDYEEELPQEKKKLKGWGSWAGPGITQPKVDKQLQVKKKLAKIEQIKKKRRDGQLSGIIIRQSYNKNLKDYFVNKLPHNFKSTEQFDYVQDEQIGQQWNTLSHFKSNIKPKIITKVGQVIQPIKMPKNIEKSKK